MPITNSTSRAIFRWQPAAWLQVAGEDAATFLQGQFTNDLRLLSGTPAVYGLWLTLKGKVLADSFALRGAAPNEFWLGSYFSAAKVIRERLESHVIADDVTLTDVTHEWAGVTAFGSVAGRVEGEYGPKHGFVFPGRRDRNDHREYVYRIADGEPQWLREPAPELISADGMERRRIAAGIPAVPADVGPADLPNEAALEAEAISYTKGCYLGQEVMARLKSMGQVRRRLLRVRGPGAAPSSLPAAVFVQARQVGELRSAVSDNGAGWIGLAMLSLLHVGDGALAFAPNGPTSLELVAAP
jgi:tRNA-modifying protein YgfZ